MDVNATFFIFPIDGRDNKMKKMEGIFITFEEYNHTWEGALFFIQTILK